MALHLYHEYGNLTNDHLLFPTVSENFSLLGNNKLNFAQYSTCLPRKENELLDCQVSRVTIWYLSMKMFKQQLIILTHVSKYQIFHILEAFQMENNFVSLILLTLTPQHQNCTSL